FRITVCSLRTVRFVKNLAGCHDTAADINEFPDVPVGKIATDNKSSKGQCECSESATLRRTMRFQKSYSATLPFGSAFSGCTSSSIRLEPPGRAGRPLQHLLLSRSDSLPACAFKQRNSGLPRCGFSPKFLPGSKGTRTRHAGQIAYLTFARFRRAQRKKA